MAEHEGHLAILFVDIIDSLHTHDSAGSAATSHAARMCLPLLQKIVTQHRGREIKSSGDGVMYAFADADSAVLAACEMQADVQQNPSAPVRDISIRIGLHFGPQLTAGVVAQRMAVMAASGQIITTGETKALLAVQQRNAIRQHMLPARAKPETVTVYEVLWQPNHDQTQLPGADNSIVQKDHGPRLRLIHAGREIIVVAKITIGRHESHGIALTDPSVSRNHALIERRDDQFILVDRSSHGTYIKLINGYEHKVWRNEAVLRGGGVLSFAHSANTKSAELVSFWRESDDIIEA
jgi:class 3 adenylate cyclase